MSLEKEEGGGAEDVKSPLGPVVSRLLSEASDRPLDADI